MFFLNLCKKKIVKYLILLNLSIIILLYPQTKVFSQTRYSTYIPATKIDIDIIPKITYYISGEKCKYDYKIISKSTSQQNVWIFDIEFYHPIEAITSPISWISGVFPDQPILEWNSQGPRFDIEPGNFKEGFSFQSKGLPGIVTYYSRGFVELPPPVPIGQGPAEKLYPPKLEDSVKGKTVGPITPPPEPFNSILFLDRLISLKDQAAQLGWITNQGVVNSLNVKLKAAKMHLERGEIKTAINILHAFVHELEAQRGKHLDDNAFYLLKPNVEFLIFKLQNP